VRGLRDEHARMRLDAERVRRSTRERRRACSRACSRLRARVPCVTGVPRKSTAQEEQVTGLPRKTQEERMHKGLLAAISIVLWPAAAAASQQLWFERNPITSPPARWASPIAYDPVRHVAVLFGGYSGTHVLDDTWEFDGFNWSQRTPAVRPAARNAHALTWDPVSQRVLLFGGSGPGLANDTWLWDGTSWTQHNPSAPAPSGRMSPCVGSTPALPGLVLLGGQSNPSSVFFGDFWHWNGTGWSQLAASTPIGTRAQAPVAFDPALGLVLAGGINVVGTGVFHNDTWVFDGATWSLLPVGPFGPPRSSCAMAFAADRGRLMLFGGEDSNGRFGDTYELTATGWQLMATPQAPSARSVGATLTTNTGAVLLFGGGDGTALGGTWIYGEATPPQVAAVGTGCSWGLGTPLLDAPFLPWQGDLFEARVTSLSPAGLPFLALGAPAAAPFNLSPLGAPGCFVQLDLAFGVASTPGLNVSGSAAWLFPIPPSFTGTFALQSALLEPSANALGVVVSNALSCTVR
jgi:hypothetical protein